MFGNGFKNHGRVTPHSKGVPDRVVWLQCEDQQNKKQAVKNSLSKTELKYIYV
jgi:hypothetical protein